MHDVKHNILSTVTCLLVVGLCNATFVADAVAGEPVYRCEEESQTLTLFESTTSRLYEHELALSGPGIFEITLETSEFAFEGFSYDRASTWSKWRLLQKSPKGLHRWTSRLQLSRNEVRYTRVQMVNNSTSCHSCTATMTLRTSGCPAEAAGL